MERHGTKGLGEDGQPKKLRRLESISLEEAERRRRHWIYRLAVACPKLPVIDPQQTVWLDRWDLIVLLVLLEVTFATPFELAFFDKVQLDATFFVNRFVDCVFIVDLVLRFFIAIPDPEKRGCWIKDSRHIARAYVTSWFILDLSSLFPVDVYYLVAADQAAGTKDSTSNLKALRLARTVRLARVTQGLRLLHRWKASMGLRNWLISIIGLLYFLMVTCHWVACIWGYIALSEGVDPDVSTWLKVVAKAKGGEIDYEDPYQVYPIALYWALMTITSIGYGDICPQNAEEYKVALACMCFMSGCWAIVIGEVCAILSTFSVHEVNYKRTMDDLNMLLADWNVDHSTRRKLRLYFIESRDLQRVAMQRAILDQMSPKLQGEILNGLHRDWCEKVKYLRGVSEVTLVHIVQRLQTHLFAPDETIHGDRTLFIVRRGVAVLLGKIMVKGASWGEDMVLDNRFLRRQDAARALCYLEVDSLHFSDLMDVAQGHPELEAKVQAAGRMIALHRAIVQLSRVVRGLRFHGAVERLTPNLTTRLIEAALSGEVDGDLSMHPLQRGRVNQLLKDAAEDDDEELHVGVLGGDLTDMETRLRTNKELAAIIQEFADEMLQAYRDKVELSLPGGGRRSPSKSTRYTNRQTSFRPRPPPAPANEERAEVPDPSEDENAVSPPASAAASSEVSDFFGVHAPPDGP